MGLKQGFLKIKAGSDGNMPQSAASMKKKLVNLMTTVFAVIIFAVYVSIDLSLDGWVDQEFDKSLVNKSNYLKTLLQEQDGRVIFNFNSEFMPEFSDPDEPQYFQVWLDDHVLARSPSLAQYPKVDLERRALLLNTNQLIDVTLPDGGIGRGVISYFHDDEFPNMAPVYLAFYEPIGALDRLLWIVDLLLIVTFFLSIFLMRMLAVRIVESGLKPLAELNEEIKHLDIHEDSKQVKEIKAPLKYYEEIEPIRQELNAFIQKNQKLLDAEKRLTGDIAHELKTPIAEIMSLSEVYQSFPNDQRIAATYSQDILQISGRLKKIVDNLLLLQRSSQLQHEQSLNVIDIHDILLMIMQELSFKFSDIESRIEINCEQDDFLADEFTIQTILTNLIDNALYYSPQQSKVRIHISLEEDTQNKNQVKIEVRNELVHPLTAQDKENLLEPLYQVDQSRTSNDRHGLGLSIVNNLAQLSHYQLKIDHRDENQIGFILTGILIDDD